MLTEIMPKNDAQPSRILGRDKRNGLGVQRSQQQRGQYWIATIPHYGYTTYLPPGVAWVKGQLERGTGGFLHWQMAIYYPKRVMLSALRSDFCETAHYEPSRSAAVEEYVHKEDTAVAGTRFELGSKPFKRGSPRDWDAVYGYAIAGDFQAIDKSILVPYYSSIKRIHQDNLKPTPVERLVSVFWGDTATGKSRDAWAAAGMEAYPKDPRTKFWDGYSGQTNIVIDEFRGDIAINHFLRWLDRYPVIVEVKGSSTVLYAEKIWITSNLHPERWYADLDSKTYEALLRRLKITHYNKPFGK